MPNVSTFHLSQNCKLQVGGATENTATSLEEPGRINSIRIICLSRNVMMDGPRTGPKIVVEGKGGHLLDRSGIAKSTSVRVAQ